MITPVILPAGHEDVPRHADLLLPTPTHDDVEGFATLYRQQYGIDLEPERAHEILGGLMRFLYLTRHNRMEPPLDSSHRNP